MEFIHFLEQLKGIAQTGLYYSKDLHDRQRYTKLLELTCQVTSEKLNLDLELVKRNFSEEAGFAAPKVGVNAAVFKDKTLLVAKRKDDGCWELPGGWAELGESPRETLVRELMEETSLSVEPLEIIDVFTRLPGDFSLYYSSFHILIKCLITSGNFSPSDETSEVKFLNEDELETLEWHRDHMEMALKAFRNQNLNFS